MYMFLTASLNKCKIKAYVYRCMECMVAQTQKKTVMKVFEVISTNVDIADGEFCNVLFANINDAKEYCKKELENKKPNNVVEDFEGKLSEYDGKSLEYKHYKGCPAIFYRSHFGNYRCVVYIKTRQIH